MGSKIQQYLFYLSNLYDTIKACGGRNKELKYPCESIL